MVTALARHAVQGRDLRAVVVAWFFEAGRPVLPGQPAVPEPPDEAVVEALAWAVRTSPTYRILQRARSAVTEAQKDDFYATATGQARRTAGAASMYDPSVVREALIDGRDVDLPPAGHLLTWCIWSRQLDWAWKKSALRHSLTRSSPPGLARKCRRRNGGTP